MRKETDEDRQRKASNRADTTEIFLTSKHAAFRDEALARAAVAGREAGIAEAKKRFPTEAEKTEMKKNKPTGGWGKLLAGIDHAGGAAMGAFERDAERYFGVTKKGERKPEKS